jgi:hypothetical protein
MGENHKKNQKGDNLGKGRPNVQCVQRIHTMLAPRPIRAR